MGTRVIRLAKGRSWAAWQAAIQDLCDEQGAEGWHLAGCLAYGTVFGTAGVLLIFQSTTDPSLGGP